MSHNISSASQVHQKGNTQENDSLISILVLCAEKLLKKIILAS